MAATLTPLPRMHPNAKTVLEFIPRFQKISFVRAPKLFAYFASTPAIRSLACPSP